MTVSGIRGRRVGVVAVVREQCYEVRRDEVEGGPICLTAESLFTVEKRDGVTLVCSKDDVERYRCAQHALPTPHAGNTV